MAQTKAGGQKVRQTNYERHGKDYYKRIGSLGGKASVGLDYQKGGKKAIGFAKYPELAAIAGAKGGSKSRRRPGNKKRPVGVTIGITVTEAEMEQLNQLAQALQDEVNVISY